MTPENADDVQQDTIFDVEYFELNPNNLVIYDTVPAIQKYKCVVSGKTKQINYSKVKNYVDKNTGEIISASKASDLGVNEFLYPLIRAQQDAALSELRKEVRDFASFVLKFRNRRRGITPNIDTLCKWYAELVGKRASHIRRYIPQLKKHILANDTLLLPIWQIPGKSTTAKDHISETFLAELTFMRIKRSYKNTESG